MTMHWGGRSLNRQIEPSPGQQHDPTVRPSRVPGMRGQGWAFFNIYRSTLVVRCSELLLPQHGVDLTRAGPLNSLFHMFKLTTFSSLHVIVTSAIKQKSTLHVWSWREAGFSIAGRGYVCSFMCSLVEVYVPMCVLLHQSEGEEDMATVCTGNNPRPSLTYPVQFPVWG